MLCRQQHRRLYSAAAAAALTIRQVDAFTDVIGFASASLTAMLFSLAEYATGLRRVFRPTCEP